MPPETVPGRRAAAGVYGSILVAALVAALSEEHASAGRLSTAVLATMIVFWIAHVWSDALGEYSATGRRPNAARLTAIGSQQWPLLEAGLVPLAPLVLGWIGVFSSTAAVTISLVLAAGQLFGWGYAAGRAGHGGRLAAIGSALITGSLGLILVVLKIAVH